MKSVLALFVILPLCYSLQRSVIAEMISELETLGQELGKFRNNASQIRNPTVPSKYMSDNSGDCKYIFFRKLRDTLEELLVKGQGKSSIKKLLANLDFTTHPPVNDQKCTMKPIKSKSVPIIPYINFLRKLLKNT